MADEIAVLLYSVTAGFPREERYGLTSPMRRAAVSVPSNIVEGCARDQPGGLPSIPHCGFWITEGTAFPVRFGEALGVLVQPGFVTD